MNLGLKKIEILGMGVSHCTYDSATDEIIRLAREQKGGIITASAVHLIMEAHKDDDLRQQVNTFDIVTPDGQPVRWALNLLGKADLKDRVYGPDLTLHVCKKAALENLKVFIYGSTPTVNKKLQERLKELFPALDIVGGQPSRFRPSTPQEDLQDVEMIEKSGAHIVFVGLGCPLQEKWAYEHRHKTKAVLICVGAAFDFHAGNLQQAPKMLQKMGLEWSFRFLMEPRRLWRRYSINNPHYILLVLRQWIR